MSTEQTPPLAIVGMGCRFPKANNANAYWANIKAGLDAITDIPDTHWDPQEYFDEDKKAPDMTYAKRGGFIDPIDFDPLEFGITPNNLEATDTTHLLGLVAARDALRDAGYATGKDKNDGREFDRDRCSAILGVTGTLELVIPLGARLGHPKWRKALKDAGVDQETADDVVKRISHEYVPWQENSFPGLLGNVAAGRIANRFDLGGTNCVVDAACASSLSALHLAAMELYTGRTDMAITGGVDTFNDIFMFMCFSKTPALSPTGNSKPFSANGDGTILGEGVGIVVLKRLDDAQRDNDKIYAVLRGIGSSSDGLGNAIYAPSAQGQSKALKNAYANAQVDPKDVELVEAHGTGTKVGDRIELEALTNIYSDGTETDKPWCAVGSVKSMIGHTKAAAGVASLIKATLALQHKVLPPSIKVEKPLDLIEAGNAPHYLNSSKRPWVASEEHKRFAALSALGFGGSNFHCVLEEADPIKTEIDWDPTVILCTFSASSKQTLSQNIQAAIKQEIADPRSFAQQSRATFKREDQFRLLIVAENKPIKELLQNALQQLENNNDKQWSLPSGIYFGSERADGSLAAVFPGQGSQRVGMLRDLSCQFPSMLDSLDKANAIFKDYSEQRLSDLIYPIPVFSREAEAAQSNELRQTNHTQPALGAVSYGAWKICQRFGIDAQAFAGHSFGELVALCASDRISETDLYKLASKRGALMASGDGDRGSMLAVSADIADVEALLEQHDWDIVIANRNSPKQVVLSGSSADIAAAQTEIKKQYRCQQLSVAAAFHSSFVADAEKPFREFLNDIAITSSATSVYANKTAESYPNDESISKDLLASQLVNPVSFIEEIQAMYKDGVRVFVEIGPGNILSNLIKSILSEQDHQCISLDASKGSKNGIADLARCFAQIAALGHSINIAAWDNDYQSQEAAAGKMSVKISGANYRSPVKDIPPRPAQAPQQAAAQSTAQANTQTNTQSTHTHMPVNNSQQQQLLQATQQSINALQQMQEQTALLHQQYLASQEHAQASITQLLQQQQQLFSGQEISTAPFPAPSFTAVPSVPVQVKPATPAHVPAPATVSTIVTATPESPAAQPTAASTTNTNLSATLLQIVSEKTGYPENMLQLEMNLDADLGIDSIKRVEILSALQDQVPGLPSIQADDMGSIQTLNDIVQYCGNLESGDATVASTTNASPTQEQNEIAPILLAIVSDKTGYPQEMLQLSMNLDADLGIDSIKRVEILSALQEAVPELPSVAADDMGNLATLEDIVNYLNQRAPQTAPAAAPSQTSNTADLESALIKIVSEKTGYPAEMLDLNMQLDAELGIDSIKRVEILSALQDYDSSLPTIEADTLAQIHSLRDIVDACAQHSAGSPAPAIATTTAAQNLEPVILEVVAEKTGYPIDMLNLDMQMDAELGIDSIKRVEILSAVQEAMPELPAVDAEEMGALQTLRDVCDALNKNAAPIAASNTTTFSLTAHNSQTDTLALTDALLQIVADKTGYPLEMLDINMQLDAELGIDSIKRVEILSALQEQIPHAPVVQADEIGNINTLKDIIDHICELDSNEHATATPSAPATVSEQAPDENSIASVKRMPVTLEAIDDYRSSKELKSSDVCYIIDDGSGLAAVLEQQLSCKVNIINEVKSIRSNSRINMLLILGMKKLSDEQLYQRFQIIQKALPILNEKQGSLIALCDFEADAVHNAAWSGIVKTASHEYDSIDCKVIHHQSELQTEALIAELQLQGPLEVSFTEKGKFTTQAHVVALDPSETQISRLSKSDTLIITGGARGVTADVALAIAQRYQSNIALLGRSPLPESEESYLSDCTDEASIKQALIKNWTSGTPTPKAINQQTTRILANREIRQSIAAIEQAGSQVLYLSCDVRDSNSVAQALTKVRDQFASITGIIHGAGVLADRFIADKTIEQFSSVWETKVHGAQHLLAATADDNLRCLVFFSSSTARFGRKGQCDYAAANETLNKMAQAYQKEHVSCKCLSINWGPWDGGMVTSELKALFRQEGVEVINCQAGAQYLCDELDHQKQDIEIVLLGDNKSETTSPSSIDYQACTREAFSTNLSCESHPFLQSHVMNGHAVLPAAMIIEWLCHAAMHENPGLQFHGLDGLHIYKGVIINSGEQYPLQLMISDTQWKDGIGFCTAELKHNDILHARANIRLADSLAQANPSTEALPQGTAASGNPYEDQRLFHGPDLQGIIEVNNCDASGIMCTSQIAPSADAWIKQPMRKQWYADPMAIDVAFQAMIVWSHALYNSASLPTRVGSYEQFKAFPQEHIQIIARVRESKKHAACADIEFIDAQGSLIARMLDYECVIDPSLAASFAKNILQEEINS